MKIEGVPFAAPEWDRVEPVERPSERGTATWRTIEVGKLRFRKVDYSPGYVADRWCARVNVLLVLQGELETELRDGRRFTLTAGTHYQVADEEEGHRSSTVSGASLFVVELGAGAFRTERPAAPLREEACRAFSSWPLVRVSRASAPGRSTCRTGAAAGRGRGVLRTRRPISRAAGPRPWATPGTGRLPHG